MKTLLFALAILPTAVFGQSIATIETNGEQLLGGIGFAFLSDAGTRVAVALDGSTTLGPSPEYGVGASVRLAFNLLSFGFGFVDLPGEGADRPRDMVPRAIVGVGFSPRVHATASVLIGRDRPVVVGLCFFF